VSVEASRYNAKANDANEGKHNTRKETETSFTTTEESCQRMLSKQREETSLKLPKLPNTSEQNSHQLDEAFASCLAAGETVFNLLDHL